MTTAIFVGAFQLPINASRRHLNVLIKCVSSNQSSFVISIPTGLCTDGVQQTIPAIGKFNSDGVLSADWVVGSQPRMYLKCFHYDFITILKSHNILMLDRNGLTQ